MYKNTEEIINDKEFLISLVEAKTAEEFVGILNDKDIVLNGITKEEAFEAFKSQANSADEFNAEQLDNVAGGFFDPISLIAIGATVAACSWIGATAYSAYKYKTR